MTDHSITVLLLVDYCRQLLEFVAPPSPTRISILTHVDEPHDGRTLDAAACEGEKEGRQTTDHEKKVKKQEHHGRQKEMANRTALDDDLDDDAPSSGVGMSVNVSPNRYNTM